MKTRLAAYITAAVLIGFAIMMLPLVLETAYPSYQPYPQSYTGAKNTSEQRDQLEEIYGLASPSGLTRSSIILIIGLILALAAYIIVRKQVNRPQVFSSSYKPF